MEGAEVAAAVAEEKVRRRIILRSRSSGSGARVEPRALEAVWALGWIPTSTTSLSFGRESTLNLLRLPPGPVPLLRRRHQPALAAPLAHPKPTSLTQPPRYAKRSAIEMFRSSSHLIRCCQMWPFTSSPTSATPPPPAPVGQAVDLNPPGIERCPVDESTRLKWLQSQGAASTPHPMTAASSSSTPTPSPVKMDRSRPHDFLPTSREVSSIPRASASILPTLADPQSAEAFASTSSSSSSSPSSSDPPSSSSAAPAESSARGENWVYPSEAQFFAAMERKKHNPNPADMATIVPIHNAVNERAWADLLKWEDGWGGKECGGIKLVTFKGTPGKITPRSFMNRFLFGSVLLFRSHLVLV